MKRAAAAGLCAALLCGMCAPAYAADTAKPAQTTTTAQTEVKAPVKLTFDTLEKTVREGNVSIRSYQQTVESAEKTDVSDQYINKYFNLSQQIDAYDKQISSLKKSRDSIEDADLRKTITAQISVLQATRDSLYQQYKDLDDDEDDAKDEQKKTVDSTRRQMQNNLPVGREQLHLPRVHAVFARADRTQPSAARPQHCADEKAGSARHRDQKHPVWPREPA